MVHVLITTTFTRAIDNVAVHTTTVTFDDEEKACAAVDRFNEGAARRTRINPAVVQTAIVQTAIVL